MRKLHLLHYQMFRLYMMYMVYWNENFKVNLWNDWVFSFLINIYRLRRSKRLRLKRLNLAQQILTPKNRQARHDKLYGSKKYQKLRIIWKTRCLYELEKSLDVFYVSVYIYIFNRFLFSQFLMASFFFTVLGFSGSEDLTSIKACQKLLKVFKLKPTRAIYCL